MALGRSKLVVGTCACGSCVSFSGTGVQSIFSVGLGSVFSIGSFALTSLFIRTGYNSYMQSVVCQETYP